MFKKLLRLIKIARIVGVDFLEAVDPKTSGNGFWYKEYQNLKNDPDGHWFRMWEDQNIAHKYEMEELARLRVLLPEVQDELRQLKEKHINLLASLKIKGVDVEFVTKNEN